MLRSFQGSHCVYFDRFMKRYFLLLWFGASAFLGQIQAQKSYKLATVAFYNVENLFDTIESTEIIDGTKNYWEKGYHISVDKNSAAALEAKPYKEELTYAKLKGKKVRRDLILSKEFTPQGKKNWTIAKYQEKLQHIARVLSEIGRKKTGDAPVIIGLSELENEHVLQELISQPALKKYDYEMVHFNSFDARGIDVGLIYQKKKIVVTYARPYPVVIYQRNSKRIYTRDILRVSGYLDGEKIHFIVNHWPSKRGGEKITEKNRVKAAKACRSVIEEIEKDEPGAKIITMGDFNEGPFEEAIKLHLKTVGNKRLSKKRGVLYNTMEGIAKKGGGTEAYRDHWDTLDQLMMTPALLDRDYTTYKLFQYGIFKPNYLTQSSGKYKGYPFRTYSFSKYAGGYSDHFPVYLYLIKNR